MRVRWWMERAGEKDLIAGAGRGVMGSPSGACMFKLRANQQSAVLTAIRTAAATAVASRTCADGRSSTM